MINKFLRLGSTERWLFASSFFQSVGNEAAYFVGITGFAAYDLKAGPELIATIMGIQSISSMVAAAISGVIIDRIGPRATLIGSLLLTIATALSSMLIGTSVPAFIVFAAVLGFVFAMSKTAYNSYGPYLHASRKNLRKVNSLVMGAAYSAAILGPLLGAMVTGKFPTMAVFLVTAVFMTIALVCIVKAPELRKPDRTRPKQNFFHETTEGIRITFKSETLRFFLAIGIVLWFSFGAFDALESLFFKDVLAVDIQWLGWFNMAVGVGLVIGVYALSRIKPKYLTALMLVGGTVLVGIGSLVYVGTLSLWFVMLGGFILGIAFGIAEPLNRTLIQADTPLESIGRVMGANQLIRVGMTLLPLAVAPTLSHMFGIQEVLIGASALTVIIALAMIPTARGLDLRLADARKLEQIHPLEEGEDVAPHDRIPIGMD